MGVGGHPGHFPAKLVFVDIAGGLVIFKAAPEDVMYLKVQVGDNGTVDWSPASTDVAASPAPESAG